MAEESDNKQQISVRGITPEALAKIDLYVQKFGGSRSSVVLRALVKFIDTDAEMLALQATAQSDGKQGE